MKGSFYPFTFLLLSMFIFSCKENITTKSLAGNYSVTATLKDSISVKDEISKEVNQAINGMERDLSNAKVEIERELELAKIDTTTSEGKIEYAAKNLAKQLTTNILTNEDGDSKISSSLGNLIGGSMDLVKNVLSDLNIDVELQEDGDIKTSGLASLYFNNMKWMYVDNHIILKDSDKEIAKLRIIDYNNQGFHSKYKDWIIQFKKNQ